MVNCALKIPLVLKKLVTLVEALMLLNGRDSTSQCAELAILTKYVDVHLAVTFLVQRNLSLQCNLCQQQYCMAGISVYWHRTFTLRQLTLGEKKRFVFKEH